MSPQDLTKHLGSWNDNLLTNQRRIIGTIGRDGQKLLCRYQGRYAYRDRRCPCRIRFTLSQTTEGQCSSVDARYPADTEQDIMPFLDRMARMYRKSGGFDDAVLVYDPFWLADFASAPPRRKPGKGCAAGQSIGAIASIELLR